jgi:hypothetical protein
MTTTDTQLAPRRTTVLQIREADLGRLEVDNMRLLYADLYDLDFVPTRIQVGDREFVYQRSFPVRGHGAIMPPYIRSLIDEGRVPLVVERNERYYVYVH